MKWSKGTLSHKPAIYGEKGEQNPTSFKCLRQVSKEMRRERERYFSVLSKSSVCKSEQGIELLNCPALAEGIFPI